MSSPRMAAFSPQPNEGCSHCSRVIDQSNGLLRSTKCGHLFCQHCVDRSYTLGHKLCLDEDCGQQLRKRDFAETAGERVVTSDQGHDAVRQQDDGGANASAHDANSVDNQPTNGVGPAEATHHMSTEKMKTREQKFKERVAPTGEVWYRDHPGYFPLVDHPLIQSWWAIQADYEEAVEIEMKKRRTWWTRAKGALGYSEKEPEKLTEQQMEKLAEALLAEEDEDVDDPIELPELTAEQLLRLEVEKDLEEEWIGRLKDESLPPYKISSQRMKEILELEESIPSLDHAIARLAEERPLIPPEYQVAEWASNHESDGNEQSVGSGKGSDKGNDGNGDNNAGNEPDRDGDPSSSGTDDQPTDHNPSDDTRSSSESSSSSSSNNDGSEDNQSDQRDDGNNLSSDDDDNNSDDGFEELDSEEEEEHAHATTFDDDGPLELELQSVSEETETDEQAQESVRSQERDDQVDPHKIAQYDPNDPDLGLPDYESTPSPKAPSLKTLERLVSFNRHASTRSWFSPNIYSPNYEPTHSPTASRASPNIYSPNYESKPSRTASRRQIITTGRRLSTVSRGISHGSRPPIDDCPNWLPDGPFYRSVDGWFWHHQKMEWVLGVPPPRSPKGPPKTPPQSSKGPRKQTSQSPKIVKYTPVKSVPLVKPYAGPTLVLHPINAEPLTPPTPKTPSPASPPTPASPKRSTVTPKSKRRQGYQGVREVDPLSPGSTVGLSIGRRVHNRQASLRKKRAAGDKANEEIERHYTPKRRRTARFDATA